MATYCTHDNVCALDVEKEIQLCIRECFFFLPVRQVSAVQYVNAPFLFLNFFKLFLGTIGLVWRGGWGAGGGKCFDFLRPVLKNQENPNEKTAREQHRKLVYI